MKDFEHMENAEETGGAVTPENYLKDQLKKADYQVWTRTTYTAESGLNRFIEFYVATRGDIENITFLVASICDWKFNEKKGALVHGGGMDMGFHAVYALSCDLYCPGEYTKEGAYKLTQHWLR